jgi:TRAP-type mannitol/chloroaromatic compound transport system substrate-binding protein
MLRRTFMVTGATGAASSLAAPAIAQAPLRWTMVMPWPRNTPGVGVNAERFARRVETMSAGRIEIRLYGAGELVPPFEVLDAVQSGTADIAHGTPYYFVGKAPALNYFTGVPFGLMAHELAAWFYFGDGLELWREVYDQFGVIPFYAGSSGTQAGGWFRREINTVEDLQGLKFRIAGLGGDVMRRLGVVTVQTPPGEIAPSLLSGAIDGAEWIGPWNDRAFGLFKVAKFYYTPAFHEPGPGLEIIINKAVWEGLPPDLQAIIETAASATANETYADFVWHNIQSLDPLVAENEIELRTFSDEIVRAMAGAARESFEELAARDELTRKAHSSFMDFLEKAVPYHQRFESSIQQMREVFLASA